MAAVPHGSALERHELAPAGLQEVGRHGRDGADDVEVEPRCLPPDLLRRIAGHLDDATDFVRFYSVCKPWRSAACPPGSTFLPWLLAPRCGDDDPFLRFHLVFSRRTLHLPSPARVGARSRILDTSSVATRGRLFFVGPAHDAWLANPLGGGGDTTPLPRLPDHLRLDEACKCTASADGSSIVMCTVPFCPAMRVPVVVATILRHEEEACPWMDVIVHRPALQSSHRFYALYHHGRIICGDEEARCISVLPLALSGHAGTGMAAVWVRPPPLPVGKTAWRTFLLQSVEEFLLVRVLMPTYMLGKKHVYVSNDEEQHFSVSVHALQVPGNGGRRDEVGWIDRELSMVHRTLFLSPGSSFCIDGIGAASGCAYFLCDNNMNRSSVYRYEFLRGVTSLVEELPSGWNANSVWFAPRPILAACH